MRQDHRTRPEPATTAAANCGAAGRPRQDRHGRRAATFAERDKTVAQIPEPRAKSGDRDGPSSPRSPARPSHDSKFGAKKPDPDQTSRSAAKSPLPRKSPEKNDKRDEGQSDTTSGGRPRGYERCEPLLARYDESAKTPADLAALVDGMTAVFQAFAARRAREEDLLPRESVSSMCAPRVRESAEDVRQLPATWPRSTTSSKTASTFQTAPARGGRTAKRGSSAGLEPHQFSGNNPDANKQEVRARLGKQVQDPNFIDNFGGATREEKEEMREMFEADKTAIFTAADKTRASSGAASPSRR